MPITRTVAISLSLSPSLNSVRSPLPSPPPHSPHTLMTPPSVSRCSGGATLEEGGGVPLVRFSPLLHMSSSHVLFTRPLHISSSRPLLHTSPSRPSSSHLTPPPPVLPFQLVYPSSRITRRPACPPQISSPVHPCLPQPASTLTLTPTHRSDELQFFVTRSYKPPSGRMEDVRRYAPLLPLPLLPSPSLLSHRILSPSLPYPTLSCRSSPPLGSPPLPSPSLPFSPAPLSFPSP